MAVGSLPDERRPPLHDSRRTSAGAVTKHAKAFRGARLAFARALAINACMGGSRRLASTTSIVGVLTAVRKVAGIATFCTSIRAMQQAAITAERDSVIRAEASARAS